MVPRLTLHEIAGIARDRFHFGAAAALLSIVMLAAPAYAGHAEWFAGAEVRGVFEENVNLSADYGEMKSDVSLRTSVSLGHYFQLADSTRLTLSAEAKYVDFARFDGLDNLESGLAASLKYKWGLGSYAPWIRVFGSAAYAGFREDIRSGDTVRSGFSLGKRLYERVFAQLAYEYDTMNARNSRFDTRNSIGSARIDYLLTETIQAWVGYSLSRGTYDIYIPGLNIPGALVVDTFEEPATVFLIRSTAQALSFGASMSLSDRWSVDASADFVDIYSPSRGRHYPDELYRGGIVYAY